MPASPSTSSSSGVCSSDLHRILEDLFFSTLVFILQRPTIVDCLQKNRHTFVIYLSYEQVRSTIFVERITKKRQKYPHHRKGRQTPTPRGKNSRKKKTQKENAANI